MLSTLANKCNSEIILVSLAVDEDTIAFDTESDGTHYVCLDNGEKIFPDFKVPLNKDERFIFCHEIIRSFIFLNKPYDIDYPIFYPSIDFELFSQLLRQASPDKAYNLTTRYQYNNGYRRYTFIPTDGDIVETFFNNILRHYNLSPEIHKVRVYLDQEKRESAFAPIVTFEIDSNTLDDDKIFSEYFSSYNDLLDKAKAFIDPQNALRATYRFVWYVTCYLYGLSFNIRNVDRSDSYPSHLPSSFLNERDIFYLFGPYLSEVILNFFNSRYSETIKALKSLYHRQLSFLPTIQDKNNSGTSRKTSFDQKRRELFEDIRNEIPKHVKHHNVLTNRIAGVFEALYYVKEIPAQERMLECGISGDEHKRLRIGFNHSQIKEILSLQGDTPQKSKELDLDISLAYDFLIDAGIQIPIFYYERDDRWFERAYRYGEDALSGKKYGYLIASTMKRLFQYIYNRDKRETIPAISFEKNGVIFQEEIDRLGLIDSLVDLIDVDDRKIGPKPAFSRHGKILHIWDEDHEGMGNNPFIFTQWCDKEGIITKSEERGVKYSDEFFENLKLSGGYLPQLISSENIAPFESIAMLLYHIDYIVDEGGNSEFLIALTTCSDYQSYLWALREELRLFFKSSTYSFNFPLKQILRCVRANKISDVEFLEEPYKRLSQYSHGAVYEIAHKIELWNKTHFIINKIDNYFESAAPELRLLYEQNLNAFVEQIRISRNCPVESEVHRFKHNLESFGQFCYSISRVLKTSLDLSVRILKKRITKAGNIHKTDLRILNNMLKELRERVRTCRELCQRQFSESVTGTSPSHLQGSAKFLSSTEFNFNKDETRSLLNLVVPEVGRLYKEVEEVYNEKYSDVVWQRRIAKMFPKIKDLERIGIDKAIEATSKCEAEDEKVHPKVAAVVIKDEKIVCTAYRGELEPGEHAEFTALIRKCGNVDLKGATLITTLEPCTQRKHNKKPCAQHIVDKGIERVIVGMIDPNPEIRGKGILYLQEKGVNVELFQAEYENKIRGINKEFWNNEWKKYKFDLMKEDPELQKHEDEVREIEEYFHDPSGVTVRILLFEGLNKKLTKDELKTLCEIYLNIDWGELEAKSKSGKIRELIRYCERKTSLEDLLEIAKRNYPNILE